MLQCSNLEPQTWNFELIYFVATTGGAFLTGIRIKI
jgi:hypothetical protein